MKAVSPKIALIGVGKDNKFGHPKEETLNKLSKLKVYRTDLHGEVTIEISKRGEMKIDTMYNFSEFTNTTKK